MSADWLAFLREQFPAYLLPHSARSSIDLDAARAFLSRFARKGDALTLISAASLLAGQAEALRGFSFRLLPDLVARLPARSVVERRLWEGGFHGALDVPATVALHLAGQETRFVTRQRRRSFELPENVLVASVGRRLLACLERLEAAGALHSDAASWGAGAAEAATQLRHLLRRSRLGEIPLETIGGAHLRAAQGARHPAFAAALGWHTQLDRVVERPTPEARAAQLAQGALLPLREPKQFEIAVLLRLIQDLDASLCGDGRGWSLSREVVLRGRRGPVARFEGPDGARLDVHYDQAPFPRGPRDEALQRYLNHSGRLRPDALFVLRRPGEPARAVVIEVKCSTRRQTLMAGLTEAQVYRAELAERYPGGVSAIAVGLGGVAASPRPEDELVLTDWAHLDRVALGARLGV